MTASNDTSATIWIDSYAIGWRGFAGWCAIVSIHGGDETILKGRLASASANEAAFHAALAGLRAVPPDSRVIVASGNDFVTKVLNRWAKGWAENGWTTKAGKPVKNREIIEELMALDAERWVCWVFEERRGVGIARAGREAQAEAKLAKEEAREGRQAGGGRVKAKVESANGAATIHCDGACAGNPGPGGWAAVVHIGGEELVLVGREADTTNNRMEMTAAIKALDALPPGVPATVVSDSSLLIRGMSEWLAGWKRKGWKGTAGPVKNRDLWEVLDALSTARPVTWRWVRGHAGDPLNERADALANAEAEAAAQEIGWNPSMRRFGPLPPTP